MIWVAGSLAFGRFDVAHKEQFRQNSINPFRQERSLSNGVNISGPYILTIPSSLQIISIRSIDLKTVPVILRINLW